MKTPVSIFPLAIVLLAVAATPSCRGKEIISLPPEKCNYTINISQGPKSVAAFNNDCKNSSIVRKDNELLLLLSSSDGNYTLAINIKGATEGVHTVRNTYPFDTGTSTLFLTSSQSPLPAALSFSQGTLTVSRLTNQVVDGVMNATAVSTSGEETFTLTGTFKNMPFLTH
jgi:hypothetical protein